LLIFAALCLPWFLFSLFYFGDIVPQSLHAKLRLYDFDPGASGRQFLSLFTPIGESRPAMILLKSFIGIFMLTGFIAVLKKHRQLLPLAIFVVAYCCAFVVSGATIFRWYLVPAVFAGYLIIATGVEWFLTLLLLKLREGPQITLTMRIVAGAILVLANGLILVHRADRFAQIQGIEDGLRKNIGLWLHDHAREGQRVFLEPAGYIGYYAGPQIRILDEVGLVTPEVVAIRRSGSGWYVPALQALDPDYIVQYSYNLDHNETEGSKIALFANEDDRRWFGSNYREIKRFDRTGSFPSIDEKEKSYVLLQKQK
jgi:hypothetical protein